MPKTLHNPKRNMNSNAPHSQNRSKPYFRASVTPQGELEILIYEEIGEYFDWDTYAMAGVTAKSVRQLLDASGQFSRIKVRINSPGGDAFEGVAIGNVLKASGKPIDVYVDAIAASAASIIAMCGTTITMASNAMLMIHKAWSYQVGNADDMRKMADTLDAIDNGAIAQTYVDRTGKPMADILDMMKGETWLSARDCVEQGFATAIAPETNDAAMALARNFKALAKMGRVPDALRNAAKKNEDLEDNANGCECDCQNCKDGECENCTDADCTDVNCADCPMQAEEAQQNATAESDLTLSTATAAAIRMKLALHAA